MKGHEWRAAVGDVRIAVDCLRQELARRALVEYAVVDHGRDMQQASAPPHPAWTVVFGNPRLGSRLLSREWELVADIPLHIGLYQHGEIVHIGYRRLFPDGDPADAQLAQSTATAEKVLRELVEAVVDQLGRERNHSPAAPLP